MTEIIKIGQMDNTVDGTYESANRVYDRGGICPTIPTRSNDQVPKILEIKDLTREVKNECLSRAEQSRAEQSRAEQSSCLIRQATKEGVIECMLPGIADLEYPNSTTRRGRVQEKGQICPTLTTENIPNVLEEWMWRGDERGIYEQRCRNILQVLWKEINQEEICEWSIRGLWCVLQKEVLRQNVHAKELLERWNGESEIFKRTWNGKEYKQSDFTEDQVREMWEEWKVGFASLGSQLEQQFCGQFNDVMSKLSFEGTSCQSLVHSMWKTYEGIGVLQQALLEIQEIWESDGSEEAEWYLIRIRKLTVKECFRLMGVSDKDADTMMAVNSQTQCYKQAGNSIVVDVMENIFREMMPDDWSQYMNPPVED